MPARVGQCMGGVKTGKIERFKNERECLFIQTNQKSSLPNKKRPGGEKGSLNNKLIVSKSMLQSPPVCIPLGSCPCPS